MESRISQRKTYLIEIMYHENHNTDVITLTTDNINWSMTQYQRNRKPFAWEIFSKAYLIFINMKNLFKKKKKPTASELQSNIVSESTSLKSKLISMLQLFILMFKK